MNKFIKLLNEEEIRVVKKLAECVYFANEKQTLLLQNIGDLSAPSKNSNY